MSSSGFVGIIYIWGQVEDTSEYLDPSSQGVYATMLWRGNSGWEKGRHK